MSYPLSEAEAARLLKDSVKVRQGMEAWLMAKQPLQHREVMRLAQQTREGTLGTPLQGGGSDEDMHFQLGDNIEYHIHQGIDPASILPNLPVTPSPIPSPVPTDPIVPPVVSVPDPNVPAVQPQTPIQTVIPPVATPDPPTVVTPPATVKDDKPSAPSATATATTGTTTAPASRLGPWGPALLAVAGLLGVGGLGAGMYSLGKTHGNTTTPVVVNNPPSTNTTTVVKPDPPTGQPGGWKLGVQVTKPDP